MNILVTGASGQLGQEIKARAKSCPHNFIYTDIVGELILDITNMEEISDFVQKNSVNVIINCAAYTNVDAAEEDEMTAGLINHLAPMYLSQVSEKFSIKFVHISTDYVFSGDGVFTTDGPRAYREDDQTDPRSVYGRTKLQGEDSIIKSGCDYAIVRTAWLYSSYGKNFVKTMVRLMGERDSLKVVSDQLGSPTYAGDLVEAVFAIIDKDATGIYHFSNEGICSWYEFACEIARLIGANTDIQPCSSEEFPQKAMRPKFSVLDKTKITALMGKAVPAWKESLKKVLA